MAGAPAPAPAAAAGQSALRGPERGGGARGAAPPPGGAQAPAAAAPREEAVGARPHHGGGHGRRGARRVGRPVGRDEDARGLRAGGRAARLVRGVGRPLRRQAEEHEGVPAPPGARRAAPADGDGVAHRRPERRAREGARGEVRRRHARDGRRRGGVRRGAPPVGREAPPPRAARLAAHVADVRLPRAPRQDVRLALDAGVLRAHQQHPLRLPDERVVGARQDRAAHPGRPRPRARAVVEAPPVRLRALGQPVLYGARRALALRAVGAAPRRAHAVDPIDPLHERARLAALPADGRSAVNTCTRWKA